MHIILLLYSASNTSPVEVPSHSPLKSIPYCNSFRTKWLTHCWAEFDLEDPPHFLLPLSVLDISLFSLYLPSPIKVLWVQWNIYNVQWTIEHNNTHFPLSVLPSSMVFVNLNLTHIIQTSDHFYRSLLKLLWSYWYFPWFFFMYEFI